MSKEQSVGSQYPANLYQCAWKVIDAVQGPTGNDKVETVRREWQRIFFNSQRVPVLGRTQARKCHHGLPLAHDYRDMVRHGAND
jgi:hypothetical protein